MKSRRHSPLSSLGVRCRVSHPLRPGDSRGRTGFVGTRVPLRNLFDYLEAGDSLDVFLDAFPDVTREQALAALRG